VSSEEVYSERMRDEEHQPAPPDQTIAAHSEPESVWNYPRPPRLEASARPLRVVHRGVVIAETSRSLRILETSHPPVYYIPQLDIAMHLLRPSSRRGSFCEFKGVATYWTLHLAPAPRSRKSNAQDSAPVVDGVPEIAVEDVVVEDVAWSYARPSGSYTALRDHLAFYASRLDECTIDGERVTAQPGDFYGGWITSHVKGPFKGAPGTLGW